MPNYIDDDTALPAQRADRRPIPPGESETKFTNATYHNALLQFCEDARDAIQELQPSIGADQFGAGVNMDEGRVDNYSDPELATKNIIIWKGADNMSTVLTGISSTGIAEGDQRLFLNDTESGWDCGQVILKHEDTNSTAANRFVCPGKHDVVVPSYGALRLIYKGSRWHAITENGWSKIAHTQALCLYPNLQIGAAGTPISGTKDNYDPTGESQWSPYGFNGSDLRFKSHSLLRFFVDAAGVTITGFDTSGLLAPQLPEEYGPVKFIVNQGPGSITLKHLNGGSSSENQIYCPYSEDYVIPAYAGALLVAPYPNLPDSVPQWRIMGMTARTVDKVDVSGRATAKQFSLQPMLSTGALASGLISDWNPGAGASVRATAHANGTIIESMVPEIAGTPGEIRIIKNIGAGPLIFLDESAASGSATVGYRFMLPLGALVVPSKGCAIFQYDDSTKWRPLDNGPALQTVNYTTFILPSILAATNVDDWNPTDATTGLSFKYIHRIKAQGQIGTILRTMNAPIQDGDTFMLMNFGSGMTIKHAAAAGGGGGRPFYCPGGADYVLASYTWALITFDSANNVWIVK
jgi:hypothetical protein